VSRKIIGFIADVGSRRYACRRKRCTDAAGELVSVLFSDTTVGQECTYCKAVMR
jgi:hypothetical protein